jgi:arylsulfatase A-like enzyme
MKYFGQIAGKATVILLTANFALSAQNKKDTPPRLNILFAFADDWGKDASCYATVNSKEKWHQSVKTPNVDRIAREGVLFNNAFAPAPSCTPCRSSLLSGQYFYRTGLGAILSGAVWDESIPTYPLLLEKRGYHIGYTYKAWGLPPNAAHGGERANYSSAGGEFRKFGINVIKMMASGKSMEDAKQAMYNEVRQNFQSFLNARKPGVPFCYWFGPTNTHRGFSRGSGKILWKIDPDLLKGKLPPFLPDCDVVREDFADYLGEAMAFDAGFGVLLKMLEEIGELDNTVVVVSGDQGSPGFTNGKVNLYDFGSQVTLAARCPSVIPANRVVDDFVNLMDLAPTFLELADVKIPEVMTGKSLVPVFRSKKSGMVDVSRDFVITGRERHVGGAREGNLPYPQRALRTQDFLYIINFEPDRWPMGDPKIVTKSAMVDYDKMGKSTVMAFADFDASPTKAWIVEHRNEEKNKLYYDFAFGKRPKEELYDLKDDPFQVVNIANNPKFKDIRLKMNQQLLSELKRTKDPRVLGDGQTFEKPPYAGGPQRKSQSIE